ncbi:MAG TPA: transposase [Bryobacteraceae bacterium]|nr:transposase [Bryobacteraceae bacterium]
MKKNSNQNSKGPTRSTKARQVKLISQASRKNDKPDAQMLARLARMDPSLLRPVRHRSEEAQKNLLTIRVRAALVEARTGLVNTARGLARATGERLGSWFPPRRKISAGG